MKTQEKGNLSVSPFKKGMRIPNATNVYKIYNKYSQGAAAF